MVDGMVGFGIVRMLGRQNSDELRLNMFKECVAGRKVMWFRGSRRGSCYVNSPKWYQCRGEFTLSLQENGP